MTTMLVLDPGDTTGWSIWEYDDETPLTHLAHGMIAGGRAGLLHHWTTAWAGLHPEVVVAEVFVNDHRTMDPDLTPVYIEGMLDVLRPGWIGQRNVMKAHAPDALLERLGYWWPGEGHDRDSARHAIARMKAIRHLPSLRMIHPPRDFAIAA